MAALCSSVTTDCGENAAFQCIPKRCKRKQENTAIAGGICFSLNVGAREEWHSKESSRDKAKDFCFRILLSIMHLYF
jgi:hypothetical protein